MLIVYLALSILGALFAPVVMMALPDAHGIVAVLVVVPLCASVAVMTAAALRLAAGGRPRPLRARVRGRLAPVWTAAAHG